MTSTIIPTITKNNQIMSQIDWGSLNTFFSNPIITVLISSGIIAFIFKLGVKNNKIEASILDLESLKKSATKLVSHVDIIKTHLVTRDGLDAGLFGPGSPLKLFPKGIKLLNASGFKKIYEDNKKWFINEAKKDKVKTLAEIDETSLKLVEHCSKEKKFADYKNIAFQNGITLDVLLRTLAIYLRDELAKELLKK